MPKRGSAHITRSIQPAATTSELDTLAEDVGKAWAKARAESFRSADREVAGGWPGTVSEARAQVLVALGARGRRDQVSVEHMQELSRTAYRAARAMWQSVALPDPEP